MGKTGIIVPPLWNYFEDKVYLVHGGTSEARTIINIACNCLENTCLHVPLTCLLCANRNPSPHHSWRPWIPWMGMDDPGSYTGLAETGVSNIQDLMPDDQIFIYNNRNKVHNSCNVFESCPNHPHHAPPPTPGLWKIVFHETGPWCQKGWRLLEKTKPCSLQA